LPELVFPRRIVFNENAGDTLINLLGTLNASRVLIVTDKRIREAGLIEGIKQSLEKVGVSFSIYDNVAPEPSVDTADDIAELAKKANPDAFIAVGGGSVIDAAKSGIVKYVRPDLDVRSISPFENIGLEARKPVLIAIPTTSGTGSDATLGVVLTDNTEDGRIKLALGSPEVVPYASILDPGMVASLPRNLKIWTGADALSHALEAYVSNQANPVSDALAEKAVALIFKYLPDAVNGDMDAIGKVHLAATMAGSAFSNSGLGVAHAIAHPLGSILGTHHGMTVGIVLPYVVEYNIEHSPEVAAKYNKLAGIVSLQLERDIGSILDGIKWLYGKLGFPLKFREAGVPRDKFNEAIDKVPFLALQDADMAFAPVIPDPEEIKSLLEKMY
jgi:alcohol dehydrogenase class IV